VSKTPLHSAADGFVAEPTYETTVVKRPRRSRWLRLVSGVVLGFALPVQLLHYNIYAYDLTCASASRECTIVAQHVTHDEVTVIGFDDIRLVQGHGETGDDHKPTGRLSLTFELKDGRSIEVSKEAYPEHLNQIGLQAYVKSPPPPSAPPNLQVRTEVSWGDRLVGMFIVLVGLIVLGSALMRTEVSRDVNTHTLQVVRRLWPLAGKTVLRARSDDIDRVWVSLQATGPEGGTSCTVWVKLKNGEDVKVAGTSSQQNADDIADAIRAKLG
jgi:hypothetical protein